MVTNPASPRNVYRPAASVVALSVRMPSRNCTNAPATAVPAPFVTRPEIDPPASRRALMFGTVVLAGTTTALESPSCAASLNHSGRSPGPEGTNSTWYDPATVMRIEYLPSAPVAASKLPATPRAVTVTPEIGVPAAFTTVPVIPLTRASWASTLGTVAPDATVTGVADSKSRASL